MVGVRVRGAAAVLLVGALFLAWGIENVGAYPPSPPCYGHSLANATQLWSQYINTTAFRARHPTLDEWFTRWADQEYEPSTDDHGEGTWTAHFDADCQLLRNQTILSYDLRLPPSLSRYGAEYRFALWLYVTSDGHATVVPDQDAPEHLIDTIESHPQIAEYLAYLQKIYPSAQWGAQLFDEKGPLAFPPTYEPSFHVGGVDVQANETLRVRFAYLPLNETWTAFPSLAVSQAVLEPALANTSCRPQASESVEVDFPEDNGFRHVFVLSCLGHAEYAIVWLQPQSGNYSVSWAEPLSQPTGGPVRRGNLTGSQLEALRRAAPSVPMNLRFAPVAGSRPARGIGLALVALSLLGLALIAPSVLCRPRRPRSSP